MTVQADARKIMARYRFVPKGKREFVAETLEHAIKHYDTLCLLGFEFQAAKYQEGVTDALKKAASVDEVVGIHNQVAEMLIKSCNLIQTVGYEAAQPKIKAKIRNFIAKHGEEPRGHFGTGGGTRVIRGTKSLAHLLAEIFPNPLRCKDIVAFLTAKCRHASKNSGT